MIDFNKEFEKLKTEAEKYDYHFSSNGTFIKEPRNIPIMEICLISASTYEDAGIYSIFKNAYQLTNEEFNNLKTFGTKYNEKTIEENGFETDNILYVENIWDIILKNITDYCSPLEYNDYGNIKIDYEKESMLTLWFYTSSNNHPNQNDFPQGYISFHMMEYQKFLKHEKIDLKLKKTRI